MAGEDGIEGGFGFRLPAGFQGVKRPHKAVAEPHELFLVNRLAANDCGLKRLAPHRRRRSMAHDRGVLLLKGLDAANLFGIGDQKIAKAPPFRRAAVDAFQNDNPIRRGAAVLFGHDDGAQTA